MSAYHRPSRPLDFMYDQANVLTARELERLEDRAVKMEPNVKKAVMNYRGLAIARSNTASDTAPDDRRCQTDRPASNRKPQSAIVRAKENSFSDVSGINRFKYFYLPLSARNSVLSSNFDLVQPPPINTNIDKKPALPVVENGSSSAASSGYDSLTSSNGMDKHKLGSANHKCQRCWRHASPEAPPRSAESQQCQNSTTKRSGSLPNIEGRRRSGASARGIQNNNLRSKTPPAEPHSPKEKENKTLPGFRRSARIGRNFTNNQKSKPLLGKDKQEELRERIERKNNEIRRQLDEKLNLLKNRHDKALKTLDESREIRAVSYAKPPIRPIRQSPLKVRTITVSKSEDLPSKTSKKKKPETDAGNKSTKTSGTQMDEVSQRTIGTCMTEETGTVTIEVQTEPQTVEETISQSEPKSQILDNIFDRKFVPEEIPDKLPVAQENTEDIVDVKFELQSLIDAALRQSVATLCQTRANEMLSSEIVRHSVVLGDVKDFVSNSLIPEAILMALDDFEQTNSDVKIVL